MKRNNNNLNRFYTFIYELRKNQIVKDYYVLLINNKFYGNIIEFSKDFIRNYKIFNKINYQYINSIYLNLTNHISKELKKDL